MKWSECSRLAEVRQALAQGHWPLACPAELRAHVGACSRCGQEVLLAVEFQAARAEGVKAAPQGSASLLWWRAQVQRRNAALTQAGRPLAAAHWFALVLVLAGVVATVVSQAPGLFGRLLAGGWTPMQSIATMRADWGLVPLLAGAGLLAMLGGVVAYLSAERR